MATDANLGYAMIVLILGAGFHVSALYMSRAKNFFTVWTVGGGEKRLKMKKVGAYFDWKDPADDRPIRWTLDPTFSRPVKRGVSYVGDAATGLLLKWDHVSRAWMEQDPKYLFAALADGREENLVNANKPGLERFIPLILGLAVITVLGVGVLLYFMYKTQVGGAAPSAVVGQ